MDGVGGDGTAAGASVLVTELVAVVVADGASGAEVAGAGAVLSNADSVVAATVLGVSLGAAVDPPATLLAVVPFNRAAPSSACTAGPATLSSVE